MTEAGATLGGMTGRRPRIALLAAPETSASVLYGLYDVLLSVGVIYPDMTAGEPGDALLDVSIVAATAEPFRCFGDILVEPRAAVADVDRVDVVVVSDIYVPIHTAPRGRFGVEVEWLRRMHDRGALIATVCSGSLLLAESGLLDGRSCTGHWAYRDLFQANYPRILFDADPILDVTGEPAGLITAGGSTSWQDLALYLVGRYCGQDHATRTAKVYLLGGHQDGQRPFSAMTRRAPTADAAIRGTLDWIAAHYADPNPVTAMAAQSRLHPRTFARRFRAATGLRPIDHVQALRMEAARERIEAGADDLDGVGMAVGYEDPTFFRRLFRRTTGLTPAAYRRKYVPIGGRAAAPILPPVPASPASQPAPS